MGADALVEGEQRYASVLQVVLDLGWVLVWFLNPQYGNVGFVPVVAPFFGHVVRKPHTPSMPTCAASAASSASRADFCSRTSRRSGDDLKREK